MRKLLTIMAIALCSTLAIAQTNQYFWYKGNLMMGNPIAQIDSVTFGENELTDTLHILLPRTIIKEVHDTTIAIVHDTIIIHDTINTCAFPDGAINGKFSISPTTQVYFSQGNLQYQPQTQRWRFADNQYDVIGEDNKNISSSYSGWIDLFGWGTGNNPLNTSMTDSDYPSFSEWGNNIIANSVSMGWRTLTTEEWTYLFSSRVNANNLYSQVSIGNQHGMIVFPDNWVQPTSIPFTAQANNWTTNVYTQEQWELLESLGAVFLPAAGTRNGTSVGVINYDGNYWSSTKVNEQTLSIYIMYNPYHLALNCTKERHFGFSVRLVQEVK